MASRAAATTGSTLSGARFPSRSTAAPRDVAAPVAKPPVLPAGLLPVVGRARPATDISVIEPDAAPTRRTVMPAVVPGPVPPRLAVRVQPSVTCMLPIGVGAPANPAPALSAWFPHDTVVPVQVIGCSLALVRAVCGTTAALRGVR